MYLERLTGDERLRMVTMAEITDARMDGDEVVLTLLDRKTGEPEELRCDLVLLGTGFDSADAAGGPRRWPASVVVDEVSVEPQLPAERCRRHVRAGCYLQGVNEATHGIADSLLSVLAVRSGGDRQRPAGPPARRPQLVATSPVRWSPANCRS